MGDDVTVISPAEGYSFAPTYQERYELELRIAEDNYIVGIQETRGNKKGFSHFVVCDPDRGIKEISGRELKGRKFLGVYLQPLDNGGLAILSVKEAGNRRVRTVLKPMVDKLVKAENESKWQSYGNDFKIR
jgi:hypothetical protein